MSNSCERRIAQTSKEIQTFMDLNGWHAGDLQEVLRMVIEFSSSQLKKMQLGAHEVWQLT